MPRQNLPPTFAHPAKPPSINDNALTWTRHPGFSLSVTPSPTIRDLADKLGLGKSTVQRALTGEGNTSKATCERVLSLAKEIGYHPDPLFSSLAKQRTRNRRDLLDIAYIHSANTKAGTYNVEAVTAAAASLGYRAHKIDPSSLGAGQRLMDVLYHRGHVGVILGPVRTPLHATILNNRHLPIVCCGRIDQLSLHTVRPDITESVQSIWRKVTAAGYRRIGAAICMHDPAVADDFDRLGTTLASQADIPESDRIPPLLSTLRDNAALLKWFNQHKPDAVIGFSVYQYYVLKDSGVDMSRLGFASLHVLPVADGKISGMHETNKSVAHESVHMLDQLIRRRSVGIPAEPLHLLIPSHWNEGTTLLPRKTQKTR